MSNAEIQNIEQLKKLPLTELLKYKSAAVYTKTGINFLGTTCFLAAFIFPTNLFISIPVVLIAATLANIGVGVDAFLVEIKKNLLRFQSTDK